MNCAVAREGPPPPPRDAPHIVQSTNRLSPPLPPPETRPREGGIDRHPAAARTAAPSAAPAQAVGRPAIRPAPLRVQQLVVGVVGQRLGGGLLQLLLDLGLKEGRRRGAGVRGKGSTRAPRGGRPRQHRPRRAQPRRGCALATSPRRICQYGVPGQHKASVKQGTPRKNDVTRRAHCVVGGHPLSLTS